MPLLNYMAPTRHTESTKRRIGYLKKPNPAPFALARIDKFGLAIRKLVSKGLRFVLSAVGKFNGNEILV